MSTHRFFDKICVLVILFAVVLTVLFMNGSALGLQTYVDEDSDSGEENQYFTANDLDGNWDYSDAAKIVLIGSDAEITGDGAYMQNGDLVIAEAGSYVITGNLTDGKITVDTTCKSKVWILLKGVTISNPDDCCFKVAEADKVFLTLAEGTENEMTSGNSYSKESLADNTDGVIFAHDDLTINGSGSLTVTSAYGHAIAANDDLVLAGGNLTLTAAEDAVHANDSIHITAADITINAEDDGIHCDTEIYILDGSINIESCYEGIEAPSIQIDGGDITIYPTDDGLNANGSDSGFDFGSMMMPAENSAPAQMGDGGFDPAQTAEGTFSGADSSADNTVPSDSADTPADPDTGVIGGDASSDIIINGGTLTIINESGMDADGIDSNGNITINGGTILVSVSSGNCALDYGSENGGTCQINGGSIIAAGGSAMAEMFGETSAQPSVALTGSTEAGSRVEVKNASGDVILSNTIPCSFDLLLFSCPEMYIGDTITLSVNDTDTEITLESSVTSVGDTAAGSFDSFQMQGNMIDPGGSQQMQDGSQTQDGTMTPDGNPQTQNGTMTPDGNPQTQNGAMTGPGNNMTPPDDSTVPPDESSQNSETKEQ